MRENGDMLAFIARLVTARGKVGDGGDPPRPWLYFYTLDEEVAEEAKEAFGYRGNIIRESRDTGMVTWKFYAYGDQALEIIEDLVPHLRGQRYIHAKKILERRGVIRNP
jgi:hypothetical protein